MRRVSMSCASRQGRRHAQDRLVGEERRALGHGVHVAGEAQLSEMIEEVFSEAARARQPLELLR